MENRVHSSGEHSKPIIPVYRGIFQQPVVLENTQRISRVNQDDVTAHAQTTMPCIYTIRPVESGVRQHALADTEQIYEIPRITQIVQSHQSLISDPKLGNFFPRLWVTGKTIYKPDFLIKPQEYDQITPAKREGVEAYVDVNDLRNDVVRLVTYLSDGRTLKNDGRVQAMRELDELFEKGNAYYAHFFRTNKGSTSVKINDDWVDMRQLRTADPVKYFEVSESYIIYTFLQGRSDPSKEPVGRQKTEFCKQMMNFFQSLGESPTGPNDPVGNYNRYRHNGISANDCYAFADNWQNMMNIAATAHSY